MVPPQRHYLVRSTTPTGQHIWRDWYRVGKLPGNYLAVEPDGTWEQHNADCAMPMWYIRNTGQFGGKADADTDADRAQEVLAAARDKRVVTIAVVDSGIDMNHEAFGGVQFLPPKNFDELNPALNDVNGHGTAVTGVIVNMLGGPQPWYRIGSYRVFNTVGYATYSAVVSAFREAIEVDNADIINFSGGGPPSMLVEEFITAHPNVVFVFSAGNAGGTAPLCPACYHNRDHVISVSAFDRTGQLTSWTNRGATTSAPGELIYTPVPDCSKTPVRLCDVALYDMLAGTSLSAPCVTAAVAGRLTLRDTQHGELKRLLTPKLNFYNLVVR